MPISSIISQPASSSIKAAYRPLVFRVGATNTDTTPIPPVVYCDIYFNGIYYKTISKTQYALLNTGVNTEWQFDIQDACQEFLKKQVPVNGGSVIISAPDVSAQAYCKFRSSGLDVNGFITPEGTAPVQGTGSNPPVAGTGTQSNTFFIVNAVLQHLNNQDLAAHLNYYKANTGSPLWSATAYPLTHRPLNYAVAKDDNDYYPFISTVSRTQKILRIKYRMKGLSAFVEDEVVLPATILNAGVYYLPAGPRNLSSLFPAIDWRLVDVHFVELYDTTNNLVMSTCYYKNIFNPDLKTRVCFLNYLGAFDSITLRNTAISHEATAAGQYKRSVGYPLSKTDASIERLNVSSNDSFTGISTDYGQDDMNWLQECIDSPKAFKEVDATEGQGRAYASIVIKDGKLDKQTADQNYEYLFSVEFSYSNEFYSIRN